MINIKTYQNIGGTILDNQVYPVYFKPFPKTKDYSIGYINRYFVQKINDLTITEVNKNKYNEISSTVYNKLSIRWIISGPKNNVYKNKMLDEEDNALEVAKLIASAAPAPIKKGGIKQKTVRFKKNNLYNKTQKQRKRRRRNSKVNV